MEPIDQHISFSRLTKSSELGGQDDMFDLSMSMAVSGGKKEGLDLSSSKLSKVTQLTGGLELWEVLGDLYEDYY